MRQRGKLANWTYKLFDFFVVVSNTSENTCFWSNTLYNTFKPLRNVTEEQHFRNKFSLFALFFYFAFHPSSLSFYSLTYSLLKKSFWVRWMVLRLIKTRLITLLFHYIWFFCLLQFLSFLFYIEDILVVRILLCLLLVRLFCSHQVFCLFVCFAYFWINSVCWCV